ncbi:MAG TPA: hypothetical protein VNL70_09450, partial [Tepidisphaeraceae bacterium]|nr:hypothetical protein [Tepidisphaeraceae bacterium]
MRHAQRRSQAIKPTLILATLMLLCLPARAHETDQYTLAPDRELADLGDYLTRYFYNAIERGVNKANARIRSAIQSGAKGQELARLQSADEVTRAVNREFPYAIVLIEGLDGEFTSPRIRARYPGMLPAYKPPPSLAKYIAFPLNPMRAWNCASLKVFGVQLGTDKIGHFTDMGMHYYNAFHAARTRGQSEDRAVQRAIDIGRNDPFRGESALLGFWTAGAYSNADMAINYLGLVFYRNLTEPQMLKGQL